ncbi:MAG: O-antigen ligase family protein, partial [Planctomycetes bacterium]|nr:O-antigen ligase family protein [Planctomycetota bacterium]
LLIGGCLLLTKSRSAYLASGIGLALAWLACRSHGLRTHWKLPAALMAVVIVLAAIATLVGGLDLKVLTEASKSLGYRMQYWQATGQIIRDHPLLGTGPGNFGDYYPQYKLPEASEEIQDPHNFVLEVWSTAGAPALVALAAALGLALWRQRRLFGQESLPIERAASARPIWIGAIAALPLAFFAGLAVGLPPAIAALLIGLCLGSATVAVLRHWVRDGRLPEMLPWVALIVLCINLLAAGGIGFPGVAGTFWLLLALLLNVSDREDAQYAGGRKMAIFALVVSALLLGACGVTAYVPVMKRLQWMSLALNEPTQVQQHLQDAAAADRWSADPWVELAQLHLVRWRQTRDERDFQQFESAIREMLARRPRASELWMKSGDWHLQAWRLSGDAGRLNTAIGHYRRSVELYPNSCQRRAKLAIALRDAGWKPEADEQRTEALRLDSLTPHADQKLPAELRAELLRNSAT